MLCSRYESKEGKKGQHILPVHHSHTKQTEDRKIRSDSERLCLWLRGCRSAGKALHWPAEVHPSSIQHFQWCERTAFLSGRELCFFQSLQGSRNPSALYQTLKSQRAVTAQDLNKQKGKKRQPTPATLYSITSIPPTETRFWGKSLVTILIITPICSSDTPVFKYQHDYRTKIQPVIKADLFTKNH